MLKTTSTLELVQTVSICYYYKRTNICAVPHRLSQYLLEFLAETHPASVQYPNIRHHTKSRSLALQHSLFGGGSSEAHARLLLWLGGLREASELGNSLRRQGRMRWSRRRKVNPRWRISTIQCGVLSQHLGRGKGTKVKLLAPFRLDRCWLCGGKRRRRTQIHPCCNTRGSRGRSFNLKLKMNNVSKVLFKKNCDHLLPVHIWHYKYSILFICQDEISKNIKHKKSYIGMFLLIHENDTKQDPD